MAYRFEPDETLAEAVARTGREQLESAETALTQTIDSDPADAVHTARRALKKERALLRLTRDATDARRRRRENARLRDAARRLSQTRDAEAMAATLDELAHRYAGQIPHTAFTVAGERLRVSAGAGKDEGEAEHVRAIAARAAADIAGSRERIGEWQLQHRGWLALDGGLSRSYRRGAKAFARARRDPTMENLHEWRKRAKDLWYALRLLAPVCGATVKGEARDAHLLADLLGDDHDLAVLRRALVRRGADIPADVDALLGLIDHRRADLQTQAMLVGARVYAERPKAFRRRLHRSWRAGADRRRAAERWQPAGLAEATRPAAVA